jgi:hypothetical protein
MTEGTSMRRLVSACVALALLSVPAASHAQRRKKQPPKPPTTAPAETEKEKEPQAPPAAEPATDPAATTSSTPTAQQAPSEKPAEPEAAAEAEEGKEKEATRAVFVSGDFAFTRVDLGGITDNLDFTRSAANGFLYGLATGLRFRDFRIGARWRVFDTTEFDMWSIGGSLGYGLPLRPLSPVFTVNVGYVWDQHVERGAISSSLPTGTVLEPDVALRGLLVGLDLNASYWVTKFLRLGAFIGTDFFFLSREKAPLPQSLFPIPAETRNLPLYSESGSGVSYTLNLGFRGAFDIGF